MIYNRKSSWWPCASLRTVENSRTVMNVELTLSRSASFVSSIIDPSAFFVHFFNSFLLILKILVRDDLRRSQIETRYSKGDKGQLTNSSPLAQKAKESLKSSSVKVKLNKWILLLTFGPASVCVPESHTVWLIPMWPMTLRLWPLSTLFTWWQVQQLHENSSFLHVTCVYIDRYQHWNFCWKQFRIFLICDSNNMLNVKP